MFSSAERVCSSQLPLRMQVVQLVSCWLSSRRMLVRRDCRTRGLLVWMTMPSSTSLSQAVTRRSMPSTSTTHMRQAAISLMPFR